MRLRVRLACWLGLLPGAACGTAVGTGPTEIARELPNDTALPNPGGAAATYSTTGRVALDNEFHSPQGTNGRHCATCHHPADGWSLRPETARRLFDETNGQHPLFNVVDANTPTSDVSTVESRRQSYSMLLQGKFVRIRRPPADAEFEVIAAADPFQFATPDRLLFFRRPSPTANFRSVTVMWDGANTVAGDLFAGLSRQARGNVTGAQQGSPAADPVIRAIVDFELSLSHAQVSVPGVGRLDADGARGGPEAHARQGLVAGRFDLYDAWTVHRDPGKRRIARGQRLFNDRNPGNGRSCLECHDAANNGQNVSGSLFDVGVSAAAFAAPDMAVYTLRNKATRETLQTTDPGLGFVTGRWADLNRFKTPNLRGLAARGPYFHNGVAATLADVVRIYEQTLGFDFSPAEEGDLAAFLNAL